jgi:hypothetical protein
MNPFISYVHNGRSTQTRDERAVEAIESIRAGQYRTKIEPIRNNYARALAAGMSSQEAKQQVSSLKINLPAFMPSGSFKHRSNEGLTAHSGLICADLDNLGERLAELQTRLEQDPHVYAVFQSPTGTGLKVWVRVSNDSKDHARSFAAIARYFREGYAAEVDPRCKDEARLCFVSYDPNAYLNRDAIELPLGAALIKKAKPPGQAVPRPGTADLPSSVENRLASGAEIGERNAAAFALACQLRDAGTSQSQAEDKIREFATRCNPPLPQAEAMACVRSAFSKPPRQPALGPTHNPAQANSDVSAFMRLADLTAPEYDRCREDEATALGIRVTTLDAEVAKFRPKQEEIATNSLTFTDPEPWSEPVDPSVLLDLICATLKRFVVAPTNAIYAAALFALHTYTFDLLDISPLLVITGPTKRCGKSRFLALLAKLVRRPLTTSSASPAGLYRTIELYKPTLLIDEVDSFLEGDEQMRGLINSGHTRDAAFHLGCEKVGDDFQPRRWSTWACKIFSGIGKRWLSDTIQDRAIVIQMRRRRKDEVAERLRHSIRFDDIPRKCVRFAVDNEARIRGAEPNVPEPLNDRAADNWSPLLVLADLAGGVWPERARQAALQLSGSDESEALGMNAQLLADIRALFREEATDRLSSAELGGRLASIEGRPWAEYGKARRPISPNQIANLLREFGVSTRNVRIGAEVRKGYSLGDFEDAFSRYLPQAGLPEGYNATSLDNTADSSHLEAATTSAGSATENQVLFNINEVSSGVAAEEPKPEEDKIYA